MKIFAVCDSKDKIVGWSDNQKEADALCDRFRVKLVLDSFKVDIEEFYKRLNEKQKEYSVKKKLLVDDLNEVSDRLKDFKEEIEKN